MALATGVIRRQGKASMAPSQVAHIPGMLRPAVDRLMGPDIILPALRLTNSRVASALLQSVPSGRIMRSVS